jgi:plastocyanin
MVGLASAILLHAASRVASAVTTVTMIGALWAVLAAGTVAHAGPDGVVKGTVIFEGEPPERLALHRETDPYCAKLDKLADDVIVTRGKLKDVLVRVKNGSLPAGKPAAPARPALIDQKECMYAPRVIGLVAGQQLAVRNSDGTFHNVHGTIGGKLVWNKPAAPGDPDLALDTSTHAGDVIDVVCDVHPWMHAYAVVQDHAVFAVTGEDGAFELTGLGPGSYTLEAWHPTLGTRSLTVQIGKGAKAAVTARFSYKRSDMK